MRRHGIPLFLESSRNSLLSSNRILKAWYRSHSRFQDQTGQYGTIIIDPRGEPAIFERRQKTTDLSECHNLESG
jgi:hypothetical protein